MIKTANLIGLIKAAAPRLSEAEARNRRIAADRQGWYGNQGKFNKEYASRMNSGMGYSGRDVLDQMADEMTQMGYSREDALKQLTPMANQANMIHNSNTLRKWQEANADNQQYVNDTLGQDFDQLSRTVPGLWGINQDARQTANFAAGEGRGAYMHGSAAPAKGMTGQQILDRRSAYDAQKAQRKQQRSLNSQMQNDPDAARRATDIQMYGVARERDPRTGKLMAPASRNGGTAVNPGQQGFDPNYLDKITADAHARINGTTAQSTPFPAGIQDLRTAGTSPVQPPQAAAPTPATAPVQTPTATGYGKRMGMDAWKDAERARLKGKYDPGQIEAMLTNQAYRQSNGGRNYVNTTGYKPRNI